MRFVFSYIWVKQCLKGNLQLWMVLKGWNSLSVEYLNPIVKVSDNLRFTVPITTESNRFTLSISTESNNIMCRIGERERKCSSFYNLSTSLYTKPTSFNTIWRSIYRATCNQSVTFWFLQLISDVNWTLKHLLCSYTVPRIQQMNQFELTKSGHHKFFCSIGRFLDVQWMLMDGYKSVIERSLGKCAKWTNHGHYMCKVPGK